LNPCWIRRHRADGTPVETLTGGLFGPWGNFAQFAALVKLGVLSASIAYGVRSSDTDNIHVRLDFSLSSHPPTCRSHPGSVHVGSTRTRLAGRCPSDKDSLTFCEPLQTLQQNGSIDAIRTAVKQGRPKCTDIVPGSPLRHFLYKSRGNVQFTMPSFEPYFENALDKRRYAR
jgi:hypothetical protein